MSKIYFKIISHYLVCTLSALLATFIVGQVIIWCFPDGKNTRCLLSTVYLMNCIPLIMAAVFSLVLSEVTSTG